MTWKHELQDDLDHLHALGHGAVSLVNAAILLAVVAVVLSTGSQTPVIIERFFQLVTWLVKQVVMPIGAGYNVPLTQQLQPAFAGNSDTTGTAGSGGTGGSGMLPQGWSSTFVPGWAYGATTLSDGTIVYGYHPPTS